MLVGFNKYDGKTPPHQWLRIYSQAIDIAGGTDTTKVSYFPLALETSQLLWLNSLPENIIDTWATLGASVCVCRRTGSSVGLLRGGGWHWSWWLGQVSLAATLFLLG